VKAMSEYPAEVFDMYPEQAGAAVGFIQPFGLGEIVRNDCIEYIFNKEDGMMDSAITVKDMSGAEAFASAAMTIAAKHKGCIGFSLGKQENHVKCMFLDETSFGEDGELENNGEFTTYIWNENEYLKTVETRIEEDLEEELQHEKKVEAEENAGRDKYRVDADEPEEVDGEAEKPKNISKKIDPAMKESIRMSLLPEMGGLKKILSTHQKHQETERDTHIKNYYREKYKARYTPRQCTQGEDLILVKGNKQQSAPGTTWNTLRSSQLQNSPGAASSRGSESGLSQTSRSTSRRDQKQLQETRAGTWSATKARLGSSYTYQYSKDQKSRGPPYLHNNSSTIVQR